jgi:glycosyltransferase involved in cell wall biosynthesis
MRIGKPYVLYIGNAYPHKNLEVMIDVLKQYKAQYKKMPWQLVFVGKEDYFYARLKQHAWSKNVDDHTVFTGFVADSELPHLYQQAMAYVFPSLYEGFGLPPLEAMTYGTPVIAANASCLPEILGDAAEYFDPADVSAIIEAIHRVTENAELRQTLQDRGFAQVKRYSWQHMMQQTLNVYGDYQRWKEKQQQKTN